MVISNFDQIPEIDMRFVRGNSWEQDIGLSISVLVNDPAEEISSVEMNIRTTRANAVPNLLTIPGIRQENQNYKEDLDTSCGTYNVPKLIYTFKMSTTQTSGLPAMDLDYNIQYSAIPKSGSPPDIWRLFQGTLKRED